MSLNRVVQSWNGVWWNIWSHWQLKRLMAHQLPNTNTEDLFQQIKGLLCPKHINNRLSTLEDRDNGLNSLQYEYHLCFQGRKIKDEGPESTLRVVSVFQYSMYFSIVWYALLRFTALAYSLRLFGLHWPISFEFPRVLLRDSFFAVLHFSLAIFLFDVLYVCSDIIYLIRRPFFKNPCDTSLMAKNSSICSATLDRTPCTWFWGYLWSHLSKMKALRLDMEQKRISRAVLSSTPPQIFLLMRCWNRSFRCSLYAECHALLLKQWFTCCSKFRPLFPVKCRQTESVVLHIICSKDIMTVKRALFIEFAWKQGHVE